MKFKIFVLILSLFSILSIFSDNVTVFDICGANEHGTINITRDTPITDILTKLKEITKFDIHQFVIQEKIRQSGGKFVLGNGIYIDSEGYIGDDKIKELKLSDILNHYSGFAINPAFMQILTTNPYS